MHIVSLKPELEGLIVPSKFYGSMAAGRAVIYIGDPRRRNRTNFSSRQSAESQYLLDEGQRLADTLVKLAENSQGL